MNTIIKLIDAINIFLRYLAGLLLFLMAIVMILQIAIRSFLPKIGVIISAPWTEELPRYLLLWFIFLGAAVAARAGDLIAVEAIANMLKGTAGKVVRCLALITTVAFFGLLIWVGSRWAAFGRSETSSAMGLSLFWVYLSLPVGAFLASLSVLARLYETLLTDAGSLSAATLDARSTAGQPGEKPC